MKMESGVILFIRCWKIIKSGVVIWRLLIEFLVYYLTSYYACWLLRPRRKERDSQSVVGCHGDGATRSIDRTKASWPEHKRDLKSPHLVNHSPPFARSLNLIHQSLARRQERKTNKKRNEITTGYIQHHVTVEMAWKYSKCVSGAVWFCFVSCHYLESKMDATHVVSRFGGRQSWSFVV